MTWHKGSHVRIVVVGAGIIGAATAFHAATAGLDVLVLDRGPVGAGTTSRGEGNVLLSDKPPGPELDLAALSRPLWDAADAELRDEIGTDPFELEAKGGLVVASSPAALDALHAFARTQSAAGVRTERVGRVTDLEPALARGLPGGVLYPQDAQVQPVLAAAALLAAAERRGARRHTGEVGEALTGPDGRVAGVRTTAGDVLEADAVVNAAGPWAGEVSGRLGVPIEILPRRGFVLVTEPVGPLVRRKVYSADYVANVASSDSGLETSCVVESTQGGTVLIGASRERVGFDTAMSQRVIQRLATQAVRLFPVLAGVHLMRVYRGFRPYSPDHLPVIGPDPRDPAVLHACGHEGAGIGLAPGTGALITALLTGSPWRGADPARHTALLPDRLLEAR